MAKGKRMSVERRRSLSGYIFTLPWILGFLVFMAYPLVMSFVLSIGRVTDLVGLKTEIIGFGNYVDLFTKDVDFVPAFLSTIGTTFLSLPFILVFSLFIALLLNRDIRGKGVLRSIYFLPVILGSGFILQQLGPAADILTLPDNMKIVAGYLGPDLAKTVEDLLAQVTQICWRSGVQIIIFLSGLQSIPESYYEAAKVDSAGGWMMFWKITLPLLLPITVLNTVYTMIDSFRDTGNDIANLIVSKVFTNTKFEYGSAMGWVYFLVVSLFIALSLLLFRRFTRYE